jgi:hypothetical protein
MSVAEIERAIEKLPASEVSELMIWFENYYHKVWDAQIVANLKAGKLDDLLSEVDEEIEAGLAKPL